MMAELFEAVASWRTLLAVLVVFGVAPGLALRLIVRLYPKGDPRRKELVAELYAVPRWERPLFVAEQLELGLTEGIPARRRARRAKRRAESGEDMTRFRRLVVLTLVWFVASIFTEAAGYDRSVALWLGGGILLLAVIVTALLAVILASATVARWLAKRRISSRSR